MKKIGVMNEMEQRRVRGSKLLSGDQRFRKGKKLEITAGCCTPPHI